MECYWKISAPNHNSDLRIFACVAGLLVAGLLSGCQTSFRTVDERFTRHPAEYRRVQILPVWLHAVAKIDPTLTTNDLATLRAQTGNELCSVLQQTLTSKGYQLVGPVNVLPGPGEPPLLDGYIDEQLEAVRKDFSEALPRRFGFGTPLTFWTNRSRSSFSYQATNNSETVTLLHNPFHYQLSPALTNVLPQLGATNSEAVLLVDTRVFFQSRHERTKAAVWNYTGGGLVAITQVAANLAAFAVCFVGSAPFQPFWFDPFWRPRNSIDHKIALVDALSREVLWVNRQASDYTDPRGTSNLVQSVNVALFDLPALAETSQGTRLDP